MHNQRQIRAWAMYDWAGAAFSTTILAGFFPVFFKNFWCQGHPASFSTFRLGMANSLAGLAIALAAPLLGSVADTRGRKKFFLFLGALAGILSSTALFWVPMGAWKFAWALLVLAILGYKGGNVFYDALLPGICPPENRDRVSTLGYAFGYLGGGLLFGVNVLMTLKPGWFGLADAATAVRVSFLSVAAWWAVFAVPLFAWVKETAPAAGPGSRVLESSLHRLAATFREIRKYKPVLIFLLAYWFYIDGVGTIVVMAVDYGLSLGFDTSALILALLITQFIGIPAALAFGRLGEKLGTRQGILLGLAAYAGITVWGFFMKTQAEFYGLAAAVGLVQGGVQALSRSLYSRLIPPDRAAEFFGFYNVFGKFAAILGPALMGLVAAATGSARLSILSLAVFFVVGGALLTRVRVGQENQ